jgi:hypothetical protein
LFGRLLRKPHLPKFIIIRNRIHYIIWRLKKIEFTLTIAQAR